METESLNITPSLMEMSDYCKRLDPACRERYLAIVGKYVGKDLYLMKMSEFSQDRQHLPKIEAVDITSYLVLQTSYYTREQMKAHKSLDSYNFYHNGWISKMGVKRLNNNNVLLFARVNHSQRSHETPLKTWVIASKDGDVQAGHCDCMAGLSESCSHVGAVLFAVEDMVKREDELACTSKPCEWLMPSHVKKIPPAPVACIDFRSSQAKRQNRDSFSEAAAARAKRTRRSPVEPGSEKYMSYFQELTENFPKSAALMARDPFHKAFIPKSTKLPKSVLEYRTPLTLQLQPKELEQLCQAFELDELTTAQVGAIERATRGQSSSKTWFRQRAGRITASNRRRVLHTNAEKPAKALIKAICYPEAHRFSTAATTYLQGHQWFSECYGNKHEGQARRAYERMMTQEHEGFSCMDSGLWVNPKWPYMGASPDGMVACNCHGNGICEIKCPYSQQDEANLELTAGQKGFCLTTDGGKVMLDREHEYFYQVQAQLHISQADYCDFIVWTPHDMFVERVIPDNAFWDTVLPEVEHFFRAGVLPEVLGQKLTKSPS
ncbi:uncharacterized protein LOC113746909 isoform X1 [Larimichthys crocea]|uniref:uncharacterized protein LOC113746909 isoform X1 n=1 Tax=Larimichthys crocea TaxID=215358 RepID=UPI000F5E11B6|nr:uncharacterized protein LOC113746909 isoform X1 [Larimichthys crocea]